MILLSLQGLKLIFEWNIDINPLLYGKRLNECYIFFTYRLNYAVIFYLFVYKHWIHERIIFRLFILEIELHLTNPNSKLRYEKKGKKTNL